MGINPDVLRKYGKKFVNAVEDFASTTSRNFDDVMEEVTKTVKADGSKHKNLNKFIDDYNKAANSTEFTLKDAPATSEKLLPAVQDEGITRVNKMSQALEDAKSSKTPEARRKRRLEIENNPNSSPEARAKATAQLDAKKSKPETAAEYKQREADRINNSEAGKNYREKQKELERQARQAEYEKNKPSKPSKQDIEDARRYRREEIRDNGKTEAARNKAKEDLKRQPQEEAQQVDRTMTREQYKKQRSEERKKTRSFNEQEDGQLSLFDMGTSEPNTTSEYIVRETTGLDGKKHRIFDENKNYKSPEPEYKARETIGLDGEKHTVYDEVKPQESQIKNQDTLKVNKKTNEVDTTANVDRQAREARVNEVNKLNNGNKMERRSLGTWASEIISGTGDETHRISGRKTRAANMAKANADINAANQTYIDTGKGSAQQLYNKNSYWAKVSGEGKKTPDKFNQNDWEDLGKMQNQASAPEDVAAQNSKKGLDWDGIAGWVKENQIVTAAGIAGTAIVGASLLDDN